jgi:hypothetical protein
MAPHRELVMIEALEFGERFSNTRGYLAEESQSLTDKGPYYGFALKKETKMLFLSVLSRSS